MLRPRSEIEEPRDRPHRAPSARSTLDERFLRAARTRWHTPGAERTVARFSSLGEHGGIWLVIGAAGWAIDRPRAREWRSAAATVMGTYALNTALKLAVRRPRPSLAGLPALSATATKLSFPSAHASTSFAGARCYARLGLGAAPMYGLAAALSLSRLYLGVHYPSDVLAGAALGALSGTRRGGAAGPLDRRAARGVGAAAPGRGAPR